MFAAVQCSAVALLLAGSSYAVVTNDREYRFGEDDVSASAGDIVGNGFLSLPPDFPTTFDSVGASAAGNFQDLFTRNNIGGETNDPRYVAPGAGGAGGSTLAAEFDGTDDYLFGRRLGLPSTSDPAKDTGDPDDTDNLAPEDYSGIANRGFQLWVKPGSTSTLQSVVMDTNQHGLQITSGGTWSMSYGGTDYDSGISATVGQWDHVMVVRPDGAANGARLYLNGDVIAAAPGGYDGADNARLVVGANTSDDEGMLGKSDFFSGVVDELELFIMGTNGAAFDFGTFDAGTDNAAIVAALAGMPQGDLNLSGDVDATDVGIFIDNWLTSPKLVNEIAVADLDTYKLGDLDFNGFVDLADAFMLHQGLLASGGAGLNFALLGSGVSVPEPSTLTLIGIVIGGLFLRRR